MENTRGLCWVSEYSSLMGSKKIGDKCAIEEWIHSTKLPLIHIRNYSSRKWSKLTFMESYHRIYDAGHWRTAVDDRWEDLHVGENCFFRLREDVRPYLRVTYMWYYFGFEVEFSMREMCKGFQGICCFKNWLQLEKIPKVNIHIHVCIFCARSDFWQAHFSGDKPTAAAQV